MAGLNDALRAASERVSEEHQRLIRDRLIAYHAEIYGHAAAYETAIIVAGYAAFFALWAGVSSNISPLCRLITVGLMGISLMCYLVWHILQMLTRQTYEFQRADLFRFAQNAQRFNAEWERVEQKAAVAQLRIVRIWPYTFVPAVVLGFAGGGLVAYNALAVAFRWPQLR